MELWSYGVNEAVFIDIFIKQQFFPTLHHSIVKNSPAEPDPAPPDITFVNQTRSAANPYPLTPAPVHKSSPHPLTKPSLFSKLLSNLRNGKTSSHGLGAAAIMSPPHDYLPVPSFEKRFFYLPTQTSQLVGEGHAPPLSDVELTKRSPNLGDLFVNPHELIDVFGEFFRRVVKDK